MKEQNFDTLAILRAEDEGMVLRKYESTYKPAEVTLSQNVSFDLISEERATGEGMPEPIVRRK